MERRYDGRLPEWRYRAIARPAAASGRRASDEFQAEAERELAAHGLPCCFGEMDYPHWRRLPLFAGDSRSVCYFIGDDPSARRHALSRLILCARCPVFGRCRSVTMAKKSADPTLTTAEERSHLLEALGRM